jgi:hypothetical protein
MILLFTSFFQTIGGLAVIFALIKKSSKYPGAIFCWRAASFLMLGCGVAGLTIHYYNSKWILTHHYQLVVLRNDVGSIAVGMFITLLKICPTFEPVEKSENSSI